MKSKGLPSKNNSPLNHQRTRSQQNSIDRWKWMAAGLAATASAAVAQDQSQYYYFSGNGLYGDANDLTPTFDSGAGTLNVNFSSSFYEYFNSSTQGYARAEVSIGSDHFSALVNAHLSRSTTFTSFFSNSNTYRSTHVHSNWHENAAAKVSSFSSSTSTSAVANYGSYITPNEYWNIGITFTDPNINGGESTYGTLLVEASATANNGSVGASVSLVSLNYELTDYYWLQSVKSELNGLLSSNNSKTTNKQINSAIDAIDKALGTGNWTNGDRALGARASSYFTGAEDAVKTLETLTKAKGVSSLIISKANSSIDAIVSASYQLASQAYSTAYDEHGNTKDLDKADAALNASNSATGSTAVKDAAEAYKFSIEAEK